MLRIFSIPTSRNRTEQCDEFQGGYHLHIIQHSAFHKHKAFALVLPNPIKRNNKKIFRFASLQSEFGKSTVTNAGLNEPHFNSFILLEEGKIYTQSTAALKVVKGLSGLWPMLYLFIVIPPFIRDAAYKFIANKRYKWFGKKEECRIPSEELKGLFR